MVDLAAMVSSTLSSERRSFQSVLMLANSVRKVRQVAEVLPPELTLTVLSSQNRVVETLSESGITSSILEENDQKNLLKAYKLFVYYEDDDQILDEIKTNTLVTTGQHDVGSTTDMAINLSEKIKGAK